MSPETVYEAGRVLRIKHSEHLHDLSGVTVHVLEHFVGEYPSVEGANYYKVKLATPRERCRYCGAPRELAEAKAAPCRDRDVDIIDRVLEHEWRDASVLQVHEAWLEETP